MQLSSNNDELDINLSPDQFSCLNYLFYAEIRPSEKRKLSALDYVSERELIHCTRTKKMNEKGEVFIADKPQKIEKVEDGEVFSLQFNSEKCSYDYGWRSNRWSNDTHVVDIICVKHINNDVYKICSYCSSTPFVISSSHKKNSIGKEIKAAKFLQSTSLENVSDFLPPQKRKRRDKSSSVDDNESVVPNGRSDFEEEKLEVARVLIYMLHCPDPLKYEYDNQRLHEKVAAKMVNKLLPFSAKTSKTAMVIPSSSSSDVFNLPLKKTVFYMEDPNLPFSNIYSTNHSMESPPRRREAIESN